MGIPVWVYITCGSFINCEHAIANWEQVAASNWHGTSLWCAQQFPACSGLVIDLGSTTCDLIPVSDGQVKARGLTDLQRLCEGELVYAGVGRTPLAMLRGTVQFRDREIGIARELFATIQDALIVLGEMNPQPDSTETADGFPLTISCSQRRLARMVCAETHELTELDLRTMAEQFKGSLVSLLEEAIKTLCLRERVDFEQVILLGQGESFARPTVKRVLPNAKILSGTEIFSAEASGAAAAFAIAQLLNQSKFV
jgi:(4-(4-[2-(gamma-L-glutamylamino)ethyl]phenoxymethyl)furan-2-yl)methanamine synthase